MKHVTRRHFLGASAAITAFAARASGAHAAPRPLNILWLTCEDMSAHLGCYGDTYARTPNLDRLASEGSRFTHAFSVAGVCAPSRSCLITGMYQATLGTCHMRCNHVPPAHVRCFPAYLRRAGYYCTNNVKTDYQFPVPEDAWDDCSTKGYWRNRSRADQPFFAVFNSTLTHESQIGAIGSIPGNLVERLPGGLHDPASATLPPYYPDTELIRKHWAHMYDTVSAMDVWAGDLLQQLDEDGLAGSTVVFFFSDHGNGIPRAKRWMYDSGIHAPLIVRWPKTLEPGSVTGRLVSFVDFAPTVLSIAGVPIPDHMQGKAFLGASETPPRSHVFAARDRMDERYDIIRAARGKQFKYIRNYRPDLPYDQYLSYCESWPIMQELRRVRSEGGLNAAQQLFFRERKPLEELYDVESDPHELNNLAESSERREILESLRRAVDEWLDSGNDLGFVPETELEKWLPSAQHPATPGDTPRYEAPPEAQGDVFGRPLAHWAGVLNGAPPLQRFRAAATIALAGRAALPLLLAVSRDPEVCVAYWGIMGLGNAGVASPEIVDALVEFSRGEPVTLRLAAARSLCVLGKPDAALPVAVDAMKNTDPFVRLAAAEILDNMHPLPPSAEDALKERVAIGRDRSDYATRVARHALGFAPQH